MLAKIKFDEEDFTYFLKKITYSRYINSFKTAKDNLRPIIINALGLLNARLIDKNPEDCTLMRPALGKEILDTHFDNEVC